MLCFPPESTGATILAHPIVSASITGWPTTVLVWRALTCRTTSRQGQMPTHLRQRFKSRDIEESKSRRAPFGWAKGRKVDEENDCDLLRSEERRVGKECR